VTPLPIDDALPGLIDALSTRRAALVVAPPGSGKTTRVPPALLDSGRFSGKILLLQPRRVAARLCAARMAFERGQRVGEEIGYRVRFDERVGPRTRIEVLTEGLLTRKLMSDPFLEGVDVVILDELHERHIDGDLAIALLRDLQQEARPDLKVVAMSATLDAGPIARFLGDAAGPAPILRAEGRPYPVELRYDPRPDDRYLDHRVALAVGDMLRATDAGHVLAFLPGVGEIERVAERLAAMELDGARVVALHGRLSLDDQDAAITAKGGRRVILATNVAETSITVDGVVAVVDSGVQRVSRFDPALGTTRLLTEPIPQANADQRAGRAGRTGPGLCRRLWTEADQAGRPAHGEPELFRSDLSGMALTLIDWGADPRTFAWLEAPATGALERALELLRFLGALGPDGALTPTGRQLARLPLDPRLGRVVQEGHRRGVLIAAAGAAALASERDPWERSGLAVDLLDRVGWIDARGTGADPRSLAQVRQVRDQLVQLAQAAWGSPQARAGNVEEAVIAALLAGFPDRVGQRRAPGSRRFRLSGGAGAELGPGVEIGEAELIVAVNLDANPRSADLTIRVAGVLPPSLVTRTREVQLQWDPTRESVVHRAVERFGALILKEGPPPGPADPEAVAAVLVDALRRDGRPILPIEGEVAQWIARLRFLARTLPEAELPVWSADLRELHAELCYGRRSFTELRNLDLLGELQGRLPHAIRALVEAEAPARMEVPSGSTVALDYGDGEGAPVLAARVQQLFGMADTPRLARGRVALMVHLLAPNRLPVQVTQDLRSFWTRTYQEVRKDLRGRYPRHAWPEDPWTAIPEDRPKRRRP